MAIAVNNIFNEGTFPDNAKIVFPPPLEKHTDDKHSLTNLGILNTFSNIFEKIVTDFLISKMEDHLNP